MLLAVGFSVVSAVLFFPYVAVSQGSELPDAPDFVLKDLDGNEVTLNDFEGKVLFINFWATWCPPCREEIPGFIDMYKKYHDKGMEILGVSLDFQGAEVVKKFAAQYEINYPLVMGTEQFVQDYQPGPYIPVTIIIDRQGKIREQHAGYLGKNTLEKYFIQFSQ